MSDSEIETNPLVLRLKDRVTVLEQQVASLQLAAPRGIPKDGSPMPGEEKEKPDDSG